MNNLNVKRGDTVIVLNGKDKGKQGKVLTANPKKGSVTVEGINIVTKHVKPRGAQQPGGLQKTPGNIDASNVMVVCSTCSKQTRIAHIVVDDKKVRTCKKCGADLDKVVKTEKKTPAKKTTAKKTATKKTTKKEVSEEVKAESAE